MTAFERVIRPLLFRVGGGDAERAHELTLARLARLGKRTRRLMRARYAVDAPVDVFGVRFPNAVGLAAGMDKNGVALPAWPALGFGFVEVGTVTARAQPGNDKPRLFRLPGSEAIINRMGFNNAGASALAARLAALGPIGVPIGVSLGKSKVTPLAEAVDDYLTSYRLLRRHADYIAINVSSPNTPGLRTLQDKGALADLLTALAGGGQAFAGGGQALAGGGQALVGDAPVLAGDAPVLAGDAPVLADDAPALAGDSQVPASDAPVLVKIAPDLTEPAIAELLEVCLSHGVAGVIATNTTLGRDGLAAADQPRAGEAGGMSGRPLTEKARKVVHFVHTETDGRLPIIGVGGIMSADDARRMLDAGASLVQLYSGFVYHGPALVRAAARAAASDPAQAAAPESR